MCVWLACLILQYRPSSVDVDIHHRPCSLSLSLNAPGEIEVEVEVETLEHLHDRRFFPPFGNGSGLHDMLTCIFVRGPEGACISCLQQRIAHSRLISERGGGEENTRIKPPEEKKSLLVYCVCSGLT